MPRGYRLFYIALAGIALAGATPPHERNSGSNASGEVIASPSPPFDYSPYPDEHTKRCYDGQHQDNADRCAQWRAAVAAERAANSADAANGISYWGNWITGFGGILSLIGTGLLIWTLTETRKATSAASLSAEYARKALYSDRAWLVFSAPVNGTLHGTIDGRPVKNGMGFSIQWDNFGRTPALEADATVYIKIVKFDDDKVPRFDRPKGRSHLSGAIAPGVPVLGVEQPIDDITAEKFRKRETKIYIYGFISYKDIFESEVVRYSETCLLAEHMGGTRTEPTGTRENIRFTPIGPQNGVGDCVL